MYQHIIYLNILCNKFYSINNQYLLNKYRIKLELFNDFFEKNSKEKLIFNSFESEILFIYIININKDYIFNKYKLNEIQLINKIFLNNKIYYLNKCHKYFDVDNKQMHLPNCKCPIKAKTISNVKINIFIKMLEKQNITSLSCFDNDNNSIINFNENQNSENENLETEENNNDIIIPKSNIKLINNDRFYQALNKLNNIKKLLNIPIEENLITEENLIIKENISNDENKTVYVSNNIIDDNETKEEIIITKEYKQEIFNNLYNENTKDKNYNTKDIDNIKIEISNEEDNKTEILNEENNKTEILNEEDNKTEILNEEDNKNSYMSSIDKINKKQNDIDVNDYLRMKEEEIRKKKMLLLLKQKKDEIEKEMIDNNLINEMDECYLLVKNKNINVDLIKRIIDLKYKIKKKYKLDNDNNCIIKIDELHNLLMNLSIKFENINYKNCQNNFKEIIEYIKNIK